jgi:hypothetical protein
MILLSFIVQALVAAWVTDIFCDFNLAKNHSRALNSTSTKAGEKISADLESLEF